MWKCIAKTVNKEQPTLKMSSIFFIMFIRNTKLQ